MFKSFSRKSSSSRSPGYSLGSSSPQDNLLFSEGGSKAGQTQSLSSDARHYSTQQVLFKLKSEYMQWLMNQDGVPLHKAVKQPAADSLRRELQIQSIPSYLSSSSTKISPNFDYFGSESDAKVDANGAGPASAAAAAASLPMVDEQYSQFDVLMKPSEGFDTPEQVLRSIESLEIVHVSSLRKPGSNGSSPMSPGDNAAVSTVDYLKQVMKQYRKQSSSKHFYLTLPIGLLRPSARSSLYLPIISSKRLLALAPVCDAATSAISAGGITALVGICEGIALGYVSDRQRVKVKQAFLAVRMVLAAGSIAALTACVIAPPVHINQLIIAALLGIIVGECTKRLGRHVGMKLGIEIARSLQSSKYKKFVSLQRCDDAEFNDWLYQSPIPSIYVTQEGGSAAATGAAASDASIPQEHSPIVRSLSVNLAAIKSALREEATPLSPITVDRHHHAVNIGDCTCTSCNNRVATVLTVLSDRQMLMKSPAAVLQLCRDCYDDMIEVQRQCSIDSCPNCGSAIEHDHASSDCQQCHELLFRFGQCSSKYVKLAIDLKEPSEALRMKQFLFIDKSRMRKSLRGRGPTIMNLRESGEDGELVSLECIKPGFMQSVPSEFKNSTVKFFRFNAPYAPGVVNDEEEWESLVDTNDLESEYVQVQTPSSPVPSSY